MENIFSYISFVVFLYLVIFCHRCGLYSLLLVELNSSSSFVLFPTINVDTLLSLFRDREFYYLLLVLN